LGKAPPSQKKRNERLKSMKTNVSKKIRVTFDCPLHLKVYKENKKFSYFFHALKINKNIHSPTIHKILISLLILLVTTTGNLQFMFQREFWHFASQEILKRFCLISHSPSILKLKIFISDNLSLSFQQALYRFMI